MTYVAMTMLILGSPAALKTHCVLSQRPIICDKMLNQAKNCIVCAITYTLNISNLTHFPNYLSQRHQ